MSLPPARRHKGSKVSPETEDSDNAERIEVTSQANVESDVLVTEGERIHGGHLLTSLVVDSDCIDDIARVVDKDAAAPTSTACKSLRLDDPGITILFSSAADIHAMLALPNSPVAQGANAATSVVAFHQWIVALVPDAANQIVPNVPHGQGVVIYQLGHQEYGELMGNLNLMQWGGSAFAQGLSAGSFVQLYGSGRGTATCVRMPLGPFV